MNYSFDKHRFLSDIKTRRGELIYDLKRAEQRVEDIKREITENDAAIANIEAEIENE